MKSNKKTAERAKFRGYQALRTTMGTWSEMGKKPVEIFKTEIMTPYSLGISAIELEERLRKDLGCVWEGISFYTKKEVSERAYKQQCELIGCFATKDWQQDRWTITVMTRNDFGGFPKKDQG